jgi:steroid Delta-isomerase
MHQTQIELCIQDYFVAICQKDVEAWVATFAADGANHDPAGTPPNVGHAALRQFFVTVISAFESVLIAAEQVMVCGDRAAVKWRAEGVGKNGRAVRFAGLDVFEMNMAGKIQSLWGFWDPAAMFAELNA